MKVAEIRDFRESQGITQEELARLAKISRVSIVKVETGGGRVYWKTFSALCRALGLNPDEIEDADIYDGGRAWKDRMKAKYAP